MWGSVEKGDIYSIWESGKILHERSLGGVLKNAYGEDSGVMTRREQTVQWPRGIMFCSGSSLLWKEVANVEAEEVYRNST